MSLKPWNKFFHTISFRLFFWYAVVFSSSCLILFAVIYQQMKQQSIHHVDEAMLETMRELKEMFNTSGIESVTNHMQLESEISQQRKKCFRLLFKAGKPDKTFAKPLWKNLSVNKTLAAKTWENGQSEFETIQIPDHRSTGRILYAKINKNIIVQMGFSMSQELRMLRKARQMFIEILLIIVLPLATFSGWLMARHAMREVKQLDAVAVAIAEGSLKQRMPVSAHPTEISQLSTTFNSMMDHLQLLMSEEKEITDNIAHDLRSPLTRLKGEVEVSLSSERSPSEYRQNLESVLEEVNYLQSMVDSLLDISSAESSIIISQQNINLREFLTNIVDIFNFAAEDKQINMRLECSEDIFVLLAPAYMQRALANLLDNAIKYSTAQSDIIISAKQVEQQLTITVKDQGIGIAPHDIKKIFQRFYRAESCRSTPGTGLGLALANAIIKSHGGTLSVDSALGKGSTFSIIMPIKTI